MPVGWGMAVKISIRDLIYSLVVERCVVILASELNYFRNLKSSAQHARIFYELRVSVFS